MAEEATAVTAAPAVAAPGAEAGATASTSMPTAAPAPAVAVATADATDPTAADPAVAAVTDPAAAKPVERVVPEKYELKAPEGAMLDPVVATEFSNVAKELGLTQLEAQTVIEKMAPMLAKTETARDATRIQAMVDTAATKWAADSAKDAEFGGVNFEANMAVARETFKAYGTPELASVLKASGLETHPEVIRWAYRVGQKLVPDGKVVTGNTNSPQPTGSLEERAAAKLYGA
jgi:hypothetical protein